MAVSIAGKTTGGRNSHTGTLSASSTRGSRISMFVPSRCILTRCILTCSRYVKKSELSKGEPGMGISSRESARHPRRPMSVDVANLRFF